MRYKNLILIGTSHVAIESIKEIKQIIKEEGPDIIAVELDRKRLNSLFSRRVGAPSFKKIRKIGLKGFLFALIGNYIQQQIGRCVGVKPGSDMLVAARYAKEHKIPIALIDQDIDITMRKLSKRISKKEKWRIFVDIFRGIFFKKQEMKKLGIKNLDLTKVPKKKLIRKMIGHIKKRYPNIYKVIIKERNEIMAENIAAIMRNNPEKKLLAVVGAGHEEDLMQLIRQSLDNSAGYSFSVG